VYAIAPQIPVPLWVSLALPNPDTLQPFSSQFFQSTRLEQSHRSSFHHSARFRCKHQAPAGPTWFQGGFCRDAQSRRTQDRRHGYGQGSSCTRLVTIAWRSTERTNPRNVRRMLMRRSAPQPAIMKTPTGGTICKQRQLWTEDSLAFVKTSAQVEN
jgi:hypothetical protein